LASAWTEKKIDYEDENEDEGEGETGGGPPDPGVKSVGAGIIGAAAGLEWATDEALMRIALAQAHEALAHDDVPVGAVAVCGDRVVGRAHNQRELLHDPTAHAEMLAITQAAEALGCWRLTGVTLYVTLEPCAMCAGAMVLARIDRLVYGARDPKAGAVESLYQLLSDERLNHRVPVTAGVLGEECGGLLRQFFRKRRSENTMTNSQ